MKLPVALNHKNLNNLLAVVVVLLGLYIALAPFTPNFTLWISSILDSNHGYTYQGELANLAGEEGGDKPIPEENTLLIPEIYLEEKVLEGDNISVIDNGSVWRRPLTSTPDKGGNTVIIGHRWSYSDPATFYHLDKMKVGDKFSVYWNKQEYVYEVFEIKVVPPSEVSIEGTSTEPILTLYTCTPLWTATDRLVVVSKLISSEGGRSYE